MTRFTVNGITDERDSCDCCGKTGLKRTVCLHDHDTGLDVFFGTTCAARAMKITVKDINTQIRTAEAAKREQERRNQAARHATKAKAWRAHLTSKVGRVITDWKNEFDTLAMIEAVGGFAAAREGFSWSAP